mgnify:CR=1 FL=1
MTKPEFATGGCRCGAIRYTIRQPPVRMVQCHCVDCQKLSGTGHASQAFFREEDVELQGMPSSWVFEADSGNVKTYHFCPSVAKSFRPAPLGLICGTLSVLWLPAAPRSPPAFAQTNDAKQVQGRP